jgi:hypothetical protein
VGLQSDRKRVSPAARGRNQACLIRTLCRIFPSVPPVEIAAICVLVHAFWRCQPGSPGSGGASPYRNKEEDRSNTEGTDLSGRRKAEPKGAREVSSRNPNLARAHVAPVLGTGKSDVKSAQRFCHAFLARDAVVASGSGLFFSRSGVSRSPFAGS